MRLSVPTLVGVTLAALGAALTVAGYELSQHTAAVGNASIAAGGLVFVGYLLVLAALLILGVSVLRVILRSSPLHRSHEAR
jgi:hypothetical protein